MSAHECSIVLRFVAELPDGIEGDARSDAITDAIVATLQRDTPLGVYDESIEVRDWTSRELREGE